MAVLVQIQVISMNRLRQGNSAIAKQCSRLGRSDWLANKGTVKVDSRQFCIETFFFQCSIVWC